MMSDDDSSITSDLATLGDDSSTIDGNSSTMDDDPSFVNSSIASEEATLREVKEKGLKEKKSARAVEEKDARKRSETEAPCKWDVNRIFKGKDEDGEDRDVTASVMAVIAAHDVRRPETVRRYKAAINHCINAKPTKVEGQRFRGMRNEQRKLEVLNTCSTTEYDYRIIQASRFFTMHVTTVNAMLIELEQKLQQQKNMPGLREVKDEEPDEEEGDSEDDDEPVRWPEAVNDPTRPKLERFKAFVHHLFRHVKGSRERLCLDWMAKIMADPSEYGNPELNSCQRAKILNYFQLAESSLHASPFQLNPVKLNDFVPTRTILINRSIVLNGGIDEYERPHELLDLYPKVLERRAAKAKEEAERLVEAKKAVEAAKKAAEEEKKKAEEDKKKEKERKKRKRWENEMKKQQVKFEEDEELQDQSSDNREAPGRAEFIGQDDLGPMMNDSFDLQREEVIDNGDETTGEEEEEEEEEVEEESDDGEEEIEKYMRQVKKEEPEYAEEDEDPSVRYEEDEEMDGMEDEEEEANGGAQLPDVHEAAVDAMVEQLREERERMEEQDAQQEEEDENEGMEEDDQNRMESRSRSSSVFSDVPFPGVSNEDWARMMPGVPLLEDSAFGRMLRGGTAPRTAAYEKERRRAGSLQRKLNHDIKMEVKDEPEEEDENEGLEDDQRIHDEDTGGGHSK